MQLGTVPQVFCFEVSPAEDKGQLPAPQLTGMPAQTPACSRVPCRSPACNPQRLWAAAPPLPSLLARDKYPQSQTVNICFQRTGTDSLLWRGLPGSLQRSPQPVLASPGTVARGPSNRVLKKHSGVTARSMTLQASANIHCPHAPSYSHLDQTLDS